MGIKILDITALRSQVGKLRMALLSHMLHGEPADKIADTLSTMLQMSLKVTPVWERPIVKLSRMGLLRLAVLLETGEDEAEEAIKMWLWGQLGLPMSVGLDDLRALIADYWPEHNDKPAEVKHGIKADEE